MLINQSNRGINIYYSYWFIFNLVQTSFTQGKYTQIKKTHYLTKTFKYGTELLCYLRYHIPVVDEIDTKYRRCTQNNLTVINCISPLSDALDILYYKKTT